MSRVSLFLAACLSLVTLLANAAGGQERGGRKVRVASISFEPTKLDLAGNAKKLETWFRRAAQGGAQIAVAPEGALEGYIVNEIISREFHPDDMRRVAVSIDSPTIKRFCNLAQDLDMCLVFGFAERIGDDVFNSALFIANNGRICGKYHKMQFHEGYDSKWWFNRLGKQSRAFDTPYGRCGVLICNDRWNPRLAKIPALDGAQFLVIPSYGSTSKSQDEAVLARARETQLPVIEANVGVSLIVSDNEIVSVDRKREGITFGDITIPEKRPVDAESRDRVETEFLAWRSTEMRRRLANFVADVDPRGPGRDSDVVVLNSSQLQIVIGNNRSATVNGQAHQAGYNGVFSITSNHADTAESPFVPTYAGWNLEHYFDALPRPKREHFFEPRYAPMELRKIDEDCVELYQPTTRVFEVESWTRFSIAEPNAIDFSFRCKPHRDDYEGNFLGVFWASYINGPMDKSIYFLDGQSTLDRPLWRQFCTQTHNRDSTVKQVADLTELSFQQHDCLFANVSPLRYSVPFFYGRFRDTVLIYAFRPTPHLRFCHSPSGGGKSRNGTDTNPAWDFQLIIPGPVKGQEYEVQGRLIYKKWQGRDDVLAEAKAYLATTPAVP